MTPEQYELTTAIDCQRMIVADRPHDLDEKLRLKLLHEALRDTFHIIPNEVTTQYVYSPSRAVLKLTRP